MELINRKEEINSAHDQSQKFQQANITLYFPGTDISGWENRIKNIFASNITEIAPDKDEMTCISFHDGTDMFASVVEDTENVISQMKGMSEFFSNSPVEDKGLLEKFLIQISLFRTIIGFSFMINDDEVRSNAIIGGILKLAQDMNGFALFPDMTLYHPSGKLLLSIEGETDFDSYLPFAAKDVVSIVKDENESDISRKEKNNNMLKEQGIPFPSDMSVSAYDADSEIRSAEEVIHRLASCFCACVTAEIYSNGNFEESRSSADEAFAKLDELYAVSSYLSDEERRYIDETPDNMNVHVSFGWRYECCAVLLWSLSLLDLKKPNEYCDAAELGSIIWNNSFQSLLDKAVLRSRDEILDMQDLIHRYHWACVESRIKGKANDKLNEEIIYEWHYALNWLTGACGSKDWDSVSVTA